MFHGTGGTTLCSPRIHPFATPPLDFGDSVVPRSPTMLTPVLDNAMMQVMEKSGPDFFTPEGCEIIEINNSVEMDYTELYTPIQIKQEQDEGSGGFGAWETGIVESRVDYKSDDEGPSSPIVPDMTFMFPRTPHHSPDPSQGHTITTTTTTTTVTSTSKTLMDEDVFERTVSGGIELRRDHEAADTVADDDSSEPEEPKSSYGRTLRRGRRARRPPGHFDSTGSSATRIRHRRPGTHGGGAGKTSDAMSAAEARIAAKAALGGGVRKRPSGSMPVEDRVLAIFGEDVLRLDRDSFKAWRAATELPTLTSSENVALKRLRRRLLGRTYAKRSRDRQLAFAESIEAECDQLRAENAMIRERLQKLQRLLDEDERY